MVLRGHKLSYDMIQTVYPYLWAEIFPHIEYNANIPIWVYVFFNDKNEYVGFLSGRPTSKETIDIQWAGIVEKHRGIYSLPIFTLAIEFIHKDYKNIMGKVHNENIVALKLAMQAGFRIFGIRTFAGVVLVELLKINKEA